MTNVLETQHMQELINENTLFITPVGSRLYGLNHESSDYDYFMVGLDSTKSTHEIHDELDVRYFHWKKYLEMLLEKPNHTLYEALMSQRKMWGENSSALRPVFDNFRPGLNSLLKTYLSAGLGALREARPEYEYKRLRLAIYLARSFNTAALNNSLYNPTLTPAERDEINQKTDELMPMEEEFRRDAIRHLFLMH